MCNVTSSRSIMTPTPRLTQLQIKNNSTLQKCNQTIETARTTNTIVADTGATGHFFEGNGIENDATGQYINVHLPLTDIQPTQRGIEVMLPNSARMKSTHTAMLNMANLPPETRKVHIFPHLASGSLLSIGQPCDAGCTTLFDKQKLYIFHNGKIIMQGPRKKNQNCGQ